MKESRAIGPVMITDSIQGGRVHSVNMVEHPNVPGECMVYFEVNSSDGGSFGIYDSSTGLVRYHDLMPGDLEARGCAIDTDGTFWLGSRDGYIYSYSPGRDCFRNHGLMFEEVCSRNGMGNWRHIRSCAVGHDGKIHIAARMGHFGYFDPATDRFENLRRIPPKSTRLASVLPSPDGRVYLSAMFDYAVYCWGDGVCTEVVVPEKYFDGSDDFCTVSACGCGRDYLYISTGYRWKLLLFDAHTLEFIREVSMSEGVQDRFLSCDEGVVHFKTPDWILRYDPDTDKMEQITADETYLSEHPDLKKTLVREEFRKRFHVTRDFEFIRYADDGKTVKNISTIEPRGRRQYVQGMDVGPDNAVYIKTFQSQMVWRIDPDTHETRMIGYAVKDAAGGQPQSLINFNGKLFISVYSGGRIMVYDPAISWGDHGNPQTLVEKTPGMTRPGCYAIDGKEMLWIGGVGDWGVSGSAMVRIDRSNRIVEHHRFEDIKINSIAKSGPDCLVLATRKELCVWNIDERKIVNRIALSAHTVLEWRDGKVLAFDTVKLPGKDVCVSSPTLYSVPDLEPIREYTFPVDDVGAGCGLIGKDGFFYGTGHGQQRGGLFAMNLESGRTRILSDIPGRLLVEDLVGNLWFVRSNPVGHPLRGREGEVWMIERCQLAKLLPSDWGTDSDTN